MRKNRFLLNLIAATAIGLSVFGCDSSSSGAVADTSDIATDPFSAGNQAQVQQQNLREYMIVGQRGFTAGVFTAGANQAAPPTPDPTSGQDVTALVQGGDGQVDNNRAQMFELLGIADQPNPNANIVTPGDTAIGQGAITPDDGQTGTSGFHGTFIDPTGNFVIGATRGRVGASTAAFTTNQLQVFRLQPQQPFDVAFPPVFEFGDVPDNTPILGFQVNQGEFLSGAWSPDARHFYLGVSLAGQANSVIQHFDFNGINGDLIPASTAVFGAVASNPADLLFTSDGQFLFAIDNANDQIITYTRNAADGTLTQLATTPTAMDDPHGGTIERTGNFLYVVGRNSNSVAGFQISAAGALTPIDLTLGQNLGAIPVNLGSALGDVDANPQGDSLAIGFYNGTLGHFAINPATGGLTLVDAETPLVGQRNTTNVEFEPTGRFIFTAQQADGEDPGAALAFANVDANAVANGPFSATPIVDANNNIVFALLGTEFTGGIASYRINANNTLSADQVVEVENPFAIEFFQRVIAPAGTAAP